MSDDHDHGHDRRQFLYVTAAAAAASLAGCSGGGPDGDSGAGGADTATPTATPTDTAGGDGGDTDTVPEEYRTATALNGQQRNPDAVASKEAVSYQDEPADGRQCSGCQFYIPDQNGDGVGACAIVAGNVAPEAYCVSYVAYEG
jgi:hypothetical protein